MGSREELFLEAIHDLPSKSHPAECSHLDITEKEAGRENLLVGYTVVIIRAGSVLKKERMGFSGNLQILPQ